MVLVAVVAVSIVPTQLPPHSLPLKLLGVLIAAAGAFGYAAAVGGRSVWRFVLGWFIAMVFWATTLYGFQDAVLSMFGRQEACTVAHVQSIATRSTPQYVLTVDCGAAGRQQVRGVYAKHAVGDRLELVRMDSGLVEPLQPDRVALGRSLMLFAVAGFATAIWTLVGPAPRKRV